MLMITAAGLLVGFALVAAQETTPATDSDVANVYNSPRIVGGQDVTDRTQYAYQVSLRYYGSHFCGASIVSTKHILTAAHCCYMSGSLIDPSTISAVVGDLYITSSSDTVTKSISSITVHENYDSNTITNDIALMTLASTFEWTSTVQPVTLATEAPASGTTCVVSGWGYTQESGRISEVLQTVTVPIVDTSTCTLSYGDSIQNGMICAGYTSGGKDACQGDSGGPMVCNSELAGVVSWGYGCAREGYPGVYTDVAYYYLWIEIKINEELGTNLTTLTDEDDNTESTGVTILPFKIFIVILSVVWHLIVKIL